MKLKLAIVGLIMLGNTACVTSTNSYTRDIVYRDGSYYSPADDQYGDYYYEPEPEYDYYDNYGYNYGFGSGFYGNPWYSHHDAYRCRFSYRYDRYCDNGWGSFSLNFGGISLLFGNSGYNDYGYEYGYGYPHYAYYNPYHHHHHSAQPWNGKPSRPPIRFPDNSVSNRPSVRVQGEPTRMPNKPAMLDTETGEPIVESNSRQDLNPYTRTREPRQNRRPETWRDRDPVAFDQESGIRIENYSPRSRTKPLPVIQSGSDDQAYDRPVRRYQRPQPYPVHSDGGQAPSPIQQTRAAPERAVQVERPVRAERIERAESVVRTQKIERTSDER